MCLSLDGCIILKCLWFIASLNLFFWLASVFSVGLALLFSIVRRFLDFMIHDRAFLRSLKACYQSYYCNRNFGLCAKSMSKCLWFIASLNLFFWLASVFSVGLALLFSIVRRFLDFMIHDRAFLRSLKACYQSYYCNRNVGLCAKSMSQWRNLHRGSFWIQMQMSTRIHWWSLWHRLG